MAQTTAQVAELHAQLEKADRLSGAYLAMLWKASESLLSLAFLQRGRNLEEVNTSYAGRRSREIVLAIGKAPLLGDDPDLQELLDHKRELTNYYRKELLQVIADLNHIVAENCSDFVMETKRKLEQEINELVAQR